MVAPAEDLSKDQVIHQLHVDSGARSISDGMTCTAGRESSKKYCSH
jgi:hypothetical protein